jgi:hypothetical protein
VSSFPTRRSVGGHVDPGLRTAYEADEVEHAGQIVGRLAARQQAVTGDGWASVSQFQLM